MAAPSHAHLQRLGSILATLPRVQYAFAYGSGVHHQPGLYDAPPQSQQSTAAGGSGGAAAAGGGGAPASSGGGKQPMIDYILAVEDPESWHAQNLQRNPLHYSWLGSLGPKAVCVVADHIGVGVHFNTMVPVPGLGLVKYGVLSSAALLDDLSTWRHLYVAGRLHKPVTELPGAAAPPEVARAQGANLRAAVAAALVLLPQTFTTEDLLTTIVGHSYRGDVRLAARAEDPQKLHRIVAGSREGLEAMYLPLLKAHGDSPVGVRQEQLGGSIQGAAAPTLAGHHHHAWRQEGGTDATRALLGALPVGVLHEVADKLGFKVPESHLVMPSTKAEILHAVTSAPRPDKLVRSAMQAVVARSSGYQAVSGLLAAGGGKAYKYVAEKVAKAWGAAARHAQQQQQQRGGGHKPHHGTGGGDAGLGRHRAHQHPQQPLQQPLQQQPPQAPPAPGSS